ncbi:RHS repeat-associated core domain-containing protein [Thiohalophilus sp.]|uniref:RHS repeat-associated core domain-containing protein n=1 Tax=Thiohalophilus sp. TaxID=3028392 RepID=UPI002ACE9853|nr:RHS repeat-associated core domain-containing protein [Thiohalophilus sp.]MDZ7662429.1 RHS repeat-associated core domain-containing protein [Thiohalophilus sp.]
MRPDDVSSGAYGLIDTSNFRGLGTPCHSAYYFIHKDFRGSVSNSLNGNPVTVDFNNDAYPVGEISEAPFDDTFTGDFSVSVCPGGEEPTVDEGLAKNLGSCDSSESPSPYVSNPVHAGTGNKFERESDYSSPVASLSFVRYYNSLDDRPGVMGKGWRHSYERSVVLESGGTTAAVIRADGKTYTYTRNSGTWTTDPDVTSTLSRDGDGGWSLTLASGTVENYDAEGKLMSITTTNGRTTDLTYDSTGRLQTVTGPFDRTLSFTYDSDDRLEIFSDPDGRQYQYLYDDNDNLNNVVYPDASSRGYLYENTGYPNHLTGIIDANGQRYATYGYDNEGRAILTEHAEGADRYTLQYNGDGTTTVTDPGGRERTYHFETLHGVSKVTQIDNGPCTRCGGDARDVSYDANGFVQRKTDFNGNVTNYEHNDRGLEIARTEAVGTEVERTITTEWHPAWNKPVRISEPGRVTDYDYDSQGNRVTRIVTDPDTGKQRRTYYVYNTAGQLIQMDGPRIAVEDITTYTYNPDGTRSRITNALGHVTRISRHDGSGRPLEMVDPHGLVTTLSYDARGRLKTRTVGSQTTKFDYDPAGNLIRVTPPDGESLTYGYDNAHRVTSISDSRGNTLHYTRDAAGNITQEEVNDADGTLTRAVSRAYDDLNQLTAVFGNNGQQTTYQYDANGNRIQRADADQNATQYAFDALNRMLGQTNANGQAAQYAYDARDNLTRVTDYNGNTTTYTYDGLGNLLEQHSPDSGITTFNHDAAGNVISKTDAKGQTTNYDYDALNRVIRIRYADGSEARYTYDQGENSIGRLSRIDDASGSTVYRYDQYGRVIEKSQIIDDITLTHGYTYNATGQLVEETYPSGMTVSYAYTDGQVNRIAVNGKTILKNARWSAFGPVTRWTWGNGSVHSDRYDLDGRLYEQTLAGDRRHYQFDRRNNITGIEGSELDQHYGYDALNRLISGEQPGEFDQRFDYDPNSNRTAFDDSTGGLQANYTIASDSNRLQRITGNNAVTYEYDANGSILTKTVNGRTRTYSYNTANRLARVDNQVLYDYNALGQRVSKRFLTPAQGKGNRKGKGKGKGHSAAGFKHGHTRLFAYNEAGQIIGVYNHKGRLKEELIYFNGVPIASVREEDAIYYVHTDHLGTPRIVTSEANDVVWRWDSDPFGQTQPVSEGWGDEEFVFNLRFPGQYYDHETGLHYNYYRYYDPSTGRYMTSDPIGLEGGLNTYGYAMHNPNKYFDLYGLDVWEDMPIPSLPRRRQGLICGSGATASWVPDYYGKADFSDACRKHDDCYGDKGKECGKSRKQCDKELRDNMNKACIAAGEGALCFSVSDAYYQALRGAGLPAYNNARNRDPIFDLM